MMFNFDHCASGYDLFTLKDYIRTSSQLSTISQITYGGNKKIGEAQICVERNIAPRFTKFPSLLIERMTLSTKR